MTYSKIENVKEHFKKNFNLTSTRASFLILIVESMIKARTVNLSKLSSFIPLNIKQKSIYRRLQRFIHDISLCPHKLALFMHQLVIGDPNHKHTLILDRTNWKFGKIHLNFLFLGTYYNNQLFFLFFIPLFEKKRGCSSSSDRITLLKKFIETFGVSKIKILLGDREFIGKEWIEFLQTQSIPFSIRLRENQQTFFCSHKNRHVLFSELMKNFKKNETRFLGTKVFCRKDQAYKGFVTATKNRNGKIIVCIHSLCVKNPTKVYKKRWHIEVGFKNLKSNGFNLEDTAIICPKRVQNLINLLLITFSLSIKKALSLQDACEASILEEASQAVAEEETPFFRRESFFKKALSELTHKLIYKRNHTIKKFCSDFCKAFEALQEQKIIFEKNFSLLFVSTVM